MNAFLNAGDEMAEGDGSPSRSVPADGGGNPSGFGVPRAEEDGGLSPLQRAQVAAARVKGFLDQRAGWSAGPQGHTWSAWDSEGTNGFSLKGEDNTSPVKNEVCGQTPELGALPSVPSDEQRQKEQRELWEKLKGLDPETRGMIHGPRWPADGRINSPFGKRVDPFTKEEATHYGIDIHNPVGESVKASESGTVISVSPGLKHGENQVKVRNRDGTVSVYSHTKPTVSVGDNIYAGTVIGNTDLSGRSTGGHLHYGVIDPRTGKYIDPMTRLPQR